MANDEGKKEDKFDFTDEGEARYIGLDEARILAMQAADETPGDYGRQFRRDRMAFEPQDVEETDEYYRIVLAVRPQGDFNGAPGREEFYVEKLAQAEGAIAHRQVLAVPVPEQSRRLGLVLASVAVLVVIIASGVVGGLYFGGILPPSDSSDDTAVSTPAPAPPTPVPPVAPAPDPVEVMV
ncbi:MAG: hypothetical protein QF898_09180, partial [SAR202 cluster bacterium]|nr:hypothetical protein [SAR202 cluster bacterium]